jgi:hypothetical protein
MKTMTITTHEWPEESLNPELGLQKYDLAFDSVEETRNWIVSERIFKTYAVPMVRRGHPLFKRLGIKPGDVLSLELLSKLTHVTYYVDGQNGDGLDPHFKAAGLKRKTAASFQHFFHKWPPLRQRIWSA